MVFLPLKNSAGWPDEAKSLAYGFLKKCAWKFSLRCQKIWPSIMRQCPE